MKIDCYSHIFWDWNGTLLDDVEYCISTINTMLKKRGLTVFADKNEYHAAFGFPIEDYYKRAGFDFEKEPFDLLAAEYIKMYDSGVYACKLSERALHVLKTFNSYGKKQIILSASEKNALLKQVEFFGIARYFDAILGMSDIYAKSKIHLGADYIKGKNIDKILLVGDTVHDFETAEAIGADCVLVAGGHQKKSALLSCGAVVLNNISELV